MDNYSLWQHFLRCFTERYFQFSGRARRREYWGFTLFSILISFAISIPSNVSAVLAVLTNSQAFLWISVLLTILSVLYQLLILIPSIAVGIRRLHDRGLSGWWLLASLIPFLGFLGSIYYYGATEEGRLLLLQQDLTALITLLVLCLLILIISILLLIQYCLDSRPGENKYGPNPKAEAMSQFLEGLDATAQGEIEQTGDEAIQ